MNDFIQRIQGYPSWKQIYRLSCRMNSLKTSAASTYTPLKIQGVYERLLKNYENNLQKAKIYWFQSQLKAYYWVLIGMSWINQIQIKQFKEQQWTELQKIFKYKQIYVLEYEAMRFLPKKDKKNRNWTSEQQTILQKIIKDQSITNSSNKWNGIARLLFQVSSRKFFRTGKQCRQKWFNHLDPNKKHGDWSEQQDQIIAKCVAEQGKKWSEIAKRLANIRTQHMVKNRFKSLIIRQKRVYPNLKRQTQLLKSVYENTFCQSSVIQEQPEQINEIQPDAEVQCDEIKVENISQKSSVQNIENPIIDNKLQDNLGIIDNFRMEGEMENNYELKQIISPFCYTYTPSNQSALTPTYISPPPSVPFFLGGFSQAFHNFNMYMNHQHSNWSNFQQQQ